MSDSKIFYCLQQPYPDEEYPVYGRSEWDREFGTATWSDEVDMETIRCPMDPGHQRAGKRLSNLVVVLPSQNLGDFVWTWFSDCLMTDEVLDIFQAAGLTGFSVKPVEVKPETEKGHNLTKPPVLWELVVTGKGGDADPRSGIRLVYACQHCALLEYSSFQNGIIVDEQAWDGSDFFMVTGYPNFILVTERVKDLVIERNLTNCALIRSQDLVWGSTIRPEDVYGSSENDQKLG